jgi:hypothetical protein
MLVNTYFELSRIAGLEGLDLNNDQQALTRLKDNVTQMLLTGSAKLTEVLPWDNREVEKPDQRSHNEVPSKVIASVVMDMDDELTQDFRNKQREIAQLAADAINRETWHVSQHWHTNEEHHLIFMAHPA